MINRRCYCGTMIIFVAVRVCQYDVLEFFKSQMKLKMRQFRCFKLRIVDVRSMN
jgi:hypothetical protein